MSAPSRPGGRPWQIGHAALAWLVAGYASALPHHLPHLPLWLGLVALLCLGWRIQLLRQRWLAPGKWVRSGLALTSFGGVLLHYHTLYSLESLTALLVAAFTLKFLELHRRRDALILVYLGIFLSSLSLLFEQTMTRFAYTLASFVPWLAALVALYGDAGFRRPLSFAVRVLVQSLPLMVVLFLVLPRIGGLWMVPLERNAAVTGMTDELSLGHVARLARSGDLAFRVTFEGERPMPQELYWRGLVLSAYDGTTWRQDTTPDIFGTARSRSSGRQRGDWEAAIERRGRPIEYSVILQPTQQRWLYALDTPVALSGDIGLMPDYRLSRAWPVTARFEYRARSWLDHRLAADQLSSRVRWQSLALPEDANPETVRHARQWRAEVNDEQAYIDRVLAYFHRDFYYTLEPPSLGRHGVDDFLWRTRRGFCEHFASSFVVMMRAVGIPARIVAGYQGGEWHPDGYLVVRQYDAHAWAEIWREGRGWVRVDPTAAVAPQRVLMSVQDLLGDDPAFLADSGFSLQRYRHSPWLNSLRLQLDTLDYYWARWVVSYDRHQEQLLVRLLGSVDPWRIGLALLFVGVVLASILAAVTLRRPRSLLSDPVDRAYLQFCGRLARMGVVREPSESPQRFAARAIAALPRREATIRRITALYEAVRYADQDDDAAARSRAEFLREVRYFRRLRQEPAR